jgi:UDP-glucose 4-epimerase
MLVSDSSRLRGLGWTPRFDDLETIIKSAIYWEAAVDTDRRGAGAS